MTKTITKSPSHTYDVVIIGGGVAALSAGIFSSRRKLRTLLVMKECGGQTATTAEIENYPGMGRIEGPELIRRFVQEATQFGCESVFDEAAEIFEKDDSFVVRGVHANYCGNAVILACGKRPRNLGIENEASFLGRGLSYGMPNDASVLSGKRVAVIGGGSAAVSAALLCEKKESDVLLIHRNEVFRAEPVLMDRLARSKRITQLLGYVVHEIRGDSALSSMTLCHTQTGEKENRSVDALCVNIGFETHTTFVKDLISLNEEGKITISDACETSCPGIFAAGDSTTVPYQQIAISVGEGAKAALSACHYLAKKKGVRMVKLDWGFIR